MGKLKYSILPAVLALSALFLVLPRTGADATVRIADAAGGTWTFDAPESVPPRARIAFVNDSSVTHAIACQGCSWTTGDIQPGQSVFVVVDGDGTYAILDRYHPDKLSGSLVVGDGGPVPSPTPSPSPAA